MLTTWIFLAVLLFWAVGAYNRLVRLRSAAIQAFGGLDVHFVRITGMLGEYEAAQSPALPAQSEVRTALWAATTQFGACLAVARARPLDGGAAAALAAAREVLRTAWAAVVRAAREPREQSEGAAGPGDGEASGPDSPPAVAAPGEDALALWETRWQELWAHAALATGQFNDAVGSYNGAIRQFPARLLAWLFGFHAAQAL
ncbi:LemA family protein [Acidovorax sp. NCPPB 3859]|nr:MULTISPECIES: LemA family protein [unclassified Acidovorax]MDA8452532.1 LemA family protein [Acidovorax sp. GBBC 3297]MDA8461940.1 LemA family protein [Acidovorax sp. GBBC 3333]MDA8466973.1 LemA family protein [Acidovorax sp. GBBC 3332]MDA8472009.1 LemA family protein [Acidovorax sp. GBBC 3299]WCM78393.1 LemA family protein [Acidovorax sp. GBBC 712]